MKYSIKLTRRDGIRQRYWKNRSVYPKREIVDFRKIPEDSFFRKIYIPSAEDIPTDADEYMRVKGKKKGPVTIGEIEQGKAIHIEDIKMAVRDANKLLLNKWRSR